MNRIQRKIARIAKSKMRKLESEIITPLDNSNFCIWDVYHPNFEDFFHYNRTMRRYKKEAKKQLKEEGKI